MESPLRELKVLVTGSRQYLDSGTLFEVLNELAAVVKISAIVEGEAPGADTLARIWADDHNVPVEKFNADWKRYHQAAGPIRNQQMLDVAKPDIVVAFPLARSRGTWDMITRAAELGLPVFVIPRDRAKLNALATGTYL